MINNIQANYRNILKYFKKEPFISFEELQKEILKDKISSKEEYLKKRKPNWPSAPQTVYADWKSWRNLFGKKEFLPYDECMADVRKCGITSISDYLKRKKDTWPYQPHSTYKKYWKGWPNFLGKKKVNFLPFDKFVQQLKKYNITNANDYLKNRRPEWPHEPHEIYKGKWQGWLCLRLFSFEECRKEVLKRKFKSIEEYKRKRKKNWPCNPSSYYKKEWKGKKHFLGLKDKFLSFEECKKDVSKYKFRSERHYCKNRKPEWPSSPHFTYAKKWKGWADFLSRKDIDFLPFEKCRKEVLEFGFKNRYEYLEYKRNNKPQWPCNPDSCYKKDWKGWLHFLGKQTIHVNNFLSFEECKKDVAKCNIKTFTEYQNKRKSNWPSNPNVVYKDKWKGYLHFLSKEELITITLKELKKIVQKLGIKSAKKYGKYRKKYNKNWPCAPHEYYKNKGWKDYYDFFGKTNPKHFSIMKVKPK